jgi:phosphorylcholine metabolism protein LicD
MARKKFKFSRDFVHGNKKVNKKGSTSTVTGRHAEFLEANKFGSIVEDVPEKKENKEAEKRETK